ncbi:hypothetical protein [Peribacillus frigoritolerans]|uniref:hypothetical protein n=1 Tax=Peribacillus frigoritolerans TaxID=450367 RepID=UPI003CFE2C86
MASGKMDLMREFLIQNGADPEELDKIVEPDIIKDLGNALVFTFENDNQLGELVMSLFLQVNDMAMMIMQLQTELVELKNA